METALESIASNANVITVVASQLEATARTLSRVEPKEGEDGSSDDLAYIMQLFAMQLASIKDLAGGIEGAAEELLPEPLETASS